jgi:tetratricopeptide (TPR) repeat protein
VRPVRLVTMLLDAWLVTATATATAAAGVPGVADGDAAVARLDLPAALAAYRRAADASPDSYEAAWKLARTLADEATLSREAREQKALCVEAEKLARRAVRLDPTDPNGHAYLAVALGKLALFEGGKRKVELSREVRHEAEEALRRDPNDDLALHVLAIWNREVVQLSWVLKQFAQLLYGKLPPASLDVAVADLRRATEIRPEVIPHHVELGITLAAAKRWREAKAELERGLALPTGWFTDDYYRGLAREELETANAHLR